MAQSTQLTGVAGVHFVAARLSHCGYHAVPTTRNVRGPDLLVASIDGSKAVSVQVKSTAWAMRTRGRGKNRKPHHYEWDIGWSSARENHRDLFFALVDLKEFKEMPDVFVVPSSVIYSYLEGGDPGSWRRARYHPEISELDPYKNAWSVLEKAMGRDNR